MPRHEGVFVPHAHCTVASGDCFSEGRCLSACTARKKRDMAEQLERLCRRVVELERLVYPALHPSRARGAGAPQQGDETRGSSA